jgi:hypothetical protein
MIRILAGQDCLGYITFIELLLMADAPLVINYTKFVEEIFQDINM